MIGLLLIAATMQADAAVDLSGTTGVCIRWDGPEHIGGAVVVVSSGNAVLDAAIPSTLENIRWQRPDPPCRGGWLGIIFTAEGEAAAMPYRIAQNMDYRIPPGSSSNPDCRLWMAPALQVQFDTLAFWSVAVVCPAYCCSR